MRSIGQMFAEEFAKQLGKNSAQAAVTIAILVILYLIEEVMR